MSLLACSGNEKHCKITIDMNGTYRGPIYAQSLCNPAQQIDTFVFSNDVYVLDVTSWEYGFYRLQFDTIESLDVVAEGLHDMQICARCGYLSESTTNGMETQRLWQLKAMQSQMQNDIDTILAHRSRYEYTLLKDTAKSVLSRYRAKADKLLEQSEMLIVSIPILNIANGDQHLYNIYNDYEQFEHVSALLKQQYPSNSYINQFVQRVEKMRDEAHFMSINKIGNKALPFKIRRNDNSEESTMSAENIPYIFYYTTDTTDVAAQIANSSVYYRNNVGRVYVAAPRTEDISPRPNFVAGQLCDNGYLEEMAALQPILIVVDSEGRIKKYIVGASYRDVMSVL